MEGGLPMLNCLLQYSLRSSCACSDSSSPSKWVYAVFWRILPRSYPPPKWDHGEGLLDRAKGNKRNWILVWEDGFCDFIACERAASEYDKGIRFGADVFFKLSHEVYNYGEGLIGKIASDNSHKWVFSDSEPQNDPTFITSWNVSIDPRPRAWEAQFSSGIETIAIISVREGAIQLGSFDKIVEDLNLVLSIQRKFIYLQSIPGMYTLQRPYFPINLIDYRNSHMGLMQSSHGIDSKPQITRLKRQKYERNDKDLPSKTMYLGHNSPQNRVLTSPLYSMPPLFPSMSCNPGELSSKNDASYGAPEAADLKDTSRDIGTGNVKSGISETAVVDQINVENVSRTKSS